jgi:uncharacterized protein
MVDRAEQFLRQHGLRELRVRYHKGDLARIEVQPSALGQLTELRFRRSLIEHFRSLGFKYVALDLEGFRAGSLNQVLDVRSLQLPNTATSHPRQQG